MMYRSKVYIILALFLMSGIGFLNAQDSNADFEDEEPSDIQMFFGDPFILLDKGTYYMYGTHNSNTGIEVYTSNNLKEWEGPVGPHEGFALHEDDVYGEEAFWALEVYHVDGRYYMFFSVEEHMAIAASDDPKGPFVQEHPSVLRDHKSIDHHLFIDDDGTRYIYFANFKNGLEIWGAELHDDFSSIKEETLTKIISKSQHWENSPKEPVGTVNEGPFVVKKVDTYYLTYSANHYASPDYGIGLAYADQPLGEWTKSDQNPVIQNPDDLVGTGHSSFFKDKNGELHIVYHAHFDTEEVHPRKVYIQKAEFQKVGGIVPHQLVVHPPRIEPIHVNRTD